MNPRHGLRWMALGLLLFVFFHCDNPSGTEYDQERDFYWPDLQFYPLSPDQNNDCYLWIYDLYNESNVNDTNVVHLYSSLGDHEDLIVHFKYSNALGNRIKTWHTQTYQEMDHVLQLPPKDQEGWVLLKYHSKYSNQLCFWRYVWEIEEE